MWATQMASSGMSFSTCRMKSLSKRTKSSMSLILFMTSTINGNGGGESMESKPTSILNCQ